MLYQWLYSCMSYPISHPTALLFARLLPASPSIGAGMGCVLLGCSPWREKSSGAAWRGAGSQGSHAFRPTLLGRGQESSGLGVTGAYQEGEAPPSFLGSLRAGRCQLCYPEGGVGYAVPPLRLWALGFFHEQMYPKHLPCRLPRLLAVVTVKSRSGDCKPLVGCTESGGSRHTRRWVKSNCAGRRLNKIKFPSVVCWPGRPQNQLCAGTGL